MELTKKFSVKNANGVKEYSYEQQVNADHRKNMEDYCFVHDQFLDNCAKSILFGVFDGHGGFRVSQYLNKQFPIYFSREYKTSKKNVKLTFQNTYSLLDQKIKNQLEQSNEQGSTATVGLILIQQAQRVLYVSHVGDSSAYLFDDKGGEKLTPDHRADNPAETDRIKKSGGNLILGRVGGVLAVTRSFGDFHLKKLGLSAVPEVKRIQLRLHHKYLVVASDGLWDFITIPQISSKLKQATDMQQATKSILKAALKNGSSDNISVICLRL